MWFNGRIGVSKTFDVGSIPTTPASREIRQKQKLDCKIGLLFLLHLGNLYCNCSANRRGLFFWHTNAPFSLIGAFQDRQNGANTMTVQIRVKSAHFLRIRRAGAAASPPPAQFRFHRNCGAPRCGGRCCAPRGSGRFRRRRKRGKGGERSEPQGNLHFLPTAASG